MLKIHPSWNKEYIKELTQEQLDFLENLQNGTLPATPIEDVIAGKHISEGINWAKLCNVHNISKEELDRFLVRMPLGSQGTSAHPRYYAPGLFSNLKRNCQCFFDETAKTDSQPKNPPQKRLSKKQFYELLERDPSPLITNGSDEIETLNDVQVIWFSLCKKPLPLNEVMKLRKKYFPNLYPKEPITRKLPAQGTTSYPGQFKFVDIFK